MLDRKWMSASRLTREYNLGVDDFINFAKGHADDPSQMLCPCERCYNSKGLDERTIRSHLKANGFLKSYKIWHFHGEKIGGHGNDNRSNVSGRNVNEDEFVRDGVGEDGNDDEDVGENEIVDEIVDVLEEDLRDCPEMFDKLKLDSETPLYGGCSDHSKLSSVLELYKIKARNGWSDKSFNELLCLLKKWLPSDNVLPSKTYEAKKVLSSIGMSYEKIHACPQDCILFRNEYASLNACPKCGAKRYKNKYLTAPTKVVWYFPIIPRFRRMFRSLVDSKHLTWHEDERVRDGKYRHPADAPQWKKIDIDFPDFGSEPRNLRLALATDGVSPHGNQSTTHSTWPVLLMIYNLPPWLCMKRKYVMLSMLIAGPTQPGNDIDVYLRPLIEDLQFLWNTGVYVYDGYRKESFLLRAVLMGTINDFPAYGNLSGYSIKGQPGCPICEEDTCWLRLNHSCKNIFLGHRRFLPVHHRYRSWKKAFNGCTEQGRAPIIKTGYELYDKVMNLETKFGKPFKGNLVTRGWKKKSIFFDLPYWKHLHVRHNLDLMHIEKNVCESVIGTLLTVPNKNKDGIKSRLDMIDMEIRTELAPVKRGSRTYLPPAAHSLSRKEKITLCEFLSKIKVPEGYSSNVKSLVSMKNLKLIGMKSHDYHVLMQHFLPVGLRAILPEKVRYCLIKLCVFFKAICGKVINPIKLPKMQRDIVLVLCELEMYFPPSFFDIMVHLIVHVVREVQLCGPVYMRWMYPVERYMKVLKGYVKNRSRPEGCMVERYIVEEAVDFCTEFLSSRDTDDSSSIVHDGRTNNLIGKGTIGGKLIELSRHQWEQAHLYVLHNTPEIDLYVEIHKSEIKQMNPSMNATGVSREHNKHFIEWFKKYVWNVNYEALSDKVKWLSKGPEYLVWSYKGYCINGTTFYTKEQDDRSVVQNSGVSLVAEAMHISSSKDNNPVYANMAYYGVIEHIWVLNYTMFYIPIFCCKWVHNNSVRVDNFGFTMVDLTRDGYKDEPCILASQATQVFYVPDPSTRNWSVVLAANKKSVFEDDDDGLLDPNNEYSLEVDGLSLEIDDDEEDNAEIYVRTDHTEGIWMGEELVRKPKKHGGKTTTATKRKRKH